MVAFFGLQVLYFLIWLKTALWNWAVFWLAGRKQRTKSILDYLRANNYPEPDIYQRSAHHYLETVCENEKLPFALRHGAASDLSGLNALDSAGQIFESIRVATVVVPARHSLLYPGARHREIEFAGLR